VRQPPWSRCTQARHEHRCGLRQGGYLIRAAQWSARMKRVVGDRTRSRGRVPRDRRPTSDQSQVARLATRDFVAVRMVHAAHPRSVRAVDLHHALGHDPGIAAIECTTGATAAAPAAPAHTRQARTGSRHDRCFALRVPRRTARRYAAVEVVSRVMCRTACKRMAIAGCGATGTGSRLHGLQKPPSAVGW
jgi:hypothetical protein